MKRRVFILSLVLIGGVLLPVGSGLRGDEIHGKLGRPVADWRKRHGINGWEPPKVLKAPGASRR